MEGRYEEAAGYLRSAIKRRPDYVLASSALAKALMELGRYKRDGGRAGTGDTAISQASAAAPAALARAIPHGRRSRARREREISLRLRREDASAMEAPQGRRFPNSEL